MIGTILDTVSLLMSNLNIEFSFNVPRKVIYDALTQP